MILLLIIALSLLFICGLILLKPKKVIYKPKECSHSWEYSKYSPVTFKYLKRQCSRCPQEEYDELPAISKTNYWKIKTY